MVALSSTPASPTAPASGQSPSSVPERVRYGEPNERRVYPWGLPKHADQLRRRGPACSANTESHKRVPTLPASPSDTIRGHPTSPSSSIPSPRSSASRWTDYSDPEHSDDSFEYEPNPRCAATQTTVSSRTDTRASQYAAASSSAASSEEIHSSKDLCGHSLAAVTAKADGAAPGASSSGRIKPLTPIELRKSAPSSLEGATQNSGSVPPREVTRCAPAGSYDYVPPPPASSFRPGVQVYGYTETVAIYTKWYSLSSNQRSRPLSPPLRPYDSERRPPPQHTTTIQSTDPSTASTHVHERREHGLARDLVSPPPVEDYRPRSLITHGFIGRIGAAPPPPPPRLPSPPTAAAVIQRPFSSHEPHIQDRLTVPAPVASGLNLRVQSCGSSGHARPSKPYNRPPPAPRQPRQHASHSPPHSLASSTASRPVDASPSSPAAPPILPRSLTTRSAPPVVPTSAAARARRAAAASADAPTSPGLMTIWAYESAPTGGYKCPVPGCTESFESADTVSWHAASAHRGGGGGTYTKYKKVNGRWLCPFEHCKWSTVKYRDGTRGITGHVKNHEEGTWCSTCFVTTPPKRMHYCHYATAVKNGRLVAKKDGRRDGADE